MARIAIGKGVTSIYKKFISNLLIVISILKLSMKDMMMVFVEKW